MLHRLEHLLFVACMRFLLHSHDLLLVQDFDGIKSEIVFAAYCKFNGALDEGGHKKGSVKECDEGNMNGSSAFPASIK